MIITKIASNCFLFQLIVPSLEKIVDIRSHPITPSIAKNPHTEVKDLLAKEKCFKVKGKDAQEMNIDN